MCAYKPNERDLVQPAQSGFDIHTNARSVIFYGRIFAAINIGGLSRALRMDGAGMLSKCGGLRAGPA